MQEQVYKVAFAIEAQQFQQQLEALKRSWGVFTAAIEQTQGALWNATVLGFQMSIAGRNWAENLYEVATQADVIRLKMESFEQAVRTSGESMDIAKAAVQELADEFQILPDQVANAMGLLLRKGFKIDEARVILERFADSAVNVGRDIADGLEAGASALLQERSILLNSVGIAENISTAYNQMAKSLHKSVNALTEAEKRQAMMNLVLQSTANRVGLAQKYLSGFRGQVQKFSREWRKFITDFGKGVAAAFAPFITGMRLILQMLNALPRQLRILLGILSTLGSLGVLLGGVVFLSVSNILRFVTTVKRTLADTIKSLTLAIEMYRKSNQVMAELGLTAMATSKELDRLAMSLLSAYTATNNATLSHAITNLSRLATDGQAARQVIIQLAKDMGRAFDANAIADLSKFKKIRSELDGMTKSLSKDLIKIRTFEASLIGMLRQLSGKRFNIDDIVQVDPRIIDELRAVGLEATRASRILALAEDASLGRLALTEKQLIAVKRAVQGLEVAYLGLGRATARSAMEMGLSTEKLQLGMKQTQKVFADMQKAIVGQKLIAKFDAKDIVDYRSIIESTERAFEKAGLKAAIVLEDSMRRSLEAGTVISASAFLEGIKAIRAWPKDIGDAAKASEVFELSGRELAKAMKEVRAATLMTADSYKLAMTNMATITRTVTNAIIASLRKLRLESAAVAVENFIASMAPISLAKQIEAGGPEAVMAATRLGREAGTSMAFAFASGLYYLDQVFASVFRKINIGKYSLGFKMFGEDAAAAFKYFTRGAEDAAAAAIALTDSGTILGRVFSWLNKVQVTSAAELSLLGKVVKPLTGIILQLSNAFGFLIRAATLLIADVPIVGWFIALLMLSEKFRSAMGSLLGSLADAAISFVGMVTSAVGAVGTLVTAVMDITGASSALKMAIDVIVTVLALVASGLKQIANLFRLSSLSARKYALEIRGFFTKTMASIPVVGRYFKVDNQRIEKELRGVQDSIDKVFGDIEAEQQRLAQRMIDTWGPRWSDQLKGQFEAAVAGFSGIEKMLNQSITEGTMSSPQVLQIIDAYTEAYERLLQAMRKGGATTQDMALIQDMLSRLGKLREAVKETADEVDKFITSINDREVSIKVDLAPDALRPFRELDSELEKLKRDAEAKFKGADLAMAMAKIEEYGLQKRNALLAAYNKEFQKLYEDNEGRIRDIIAKGTDDELVQLRYERENAIRETKRRFDEQIAKYEAGSVEAVKLEEQKRREIEALNRYYNMRERALLEEQLRKDKELRLQHWEEILRMIADNNQKALELWQRQNDALIASLNQQLDKERALADMRVAIGVSSREEEDLRIAKLEQKALERQIKHEEALAKAKLNSARETANAMLQVELQRLELTRQREIADAKQSIADSKRLAATIAEINDYYSKVAAEKKKSYAYDVYLAEKEYNDKLAADARALASKQLEIEKLSLEQRLALYDQQATAISGMLSKAFDSGSMSDIADALRIATAALQSLGYAGEEASKSYQKLAAAIDDARAKLDKMVSESISEANSSLKEMGKIVSGWSADPIVEGLATVDDFSKKFGVSLEVLKKLLDDIGRMPDDLKGKAADVVKPYIDSLSKLATSYDDLIARRNELQAALNSGALTPVEADAVKQELGKIDSMLARFAEAASQYVSGGAQDIKKALDDLVAQERISASRQLSDLIGVQADIYSTQMQLAGEAAQADVEAAKKRLEAAQQYYDTVLANYSKMADAEAAEKKLADARLSLLRAELDLRRSIESAFITQINAEKELAGIEAEIAAAQLKLRGQEKAADVALAQERLNAAKQYYEELRKHYADAKIGEEERKQLEQAMLDVLNAELDLRKAEQDAIRAEVEEERKRIDLAYKRLELDRSTIAAWLEAKGINKELASDYARALTYARELNLLEREIANAKKAGDESALLDLQIKRTNAASDYLDIVKSINDAVTSMQGC